MEDTEFAEARCVFRGLEHAVRIRVTGDRLEVEVEDAVTTEQWRGEFDAQFIEDLTHKTGNFKQFSIFCNMLHSALTQSSESVTLDLLTYADLELLRHRKAGGASRQAPPPKSSALSSKRYLILIYSVEFDRIHYPLPLPYVGKPDPVYLRQVIRELKEELAALRVSTGDGSRESEVRRLREELLRVVNEKREAEIALERLQDVEIPSSKEASHVRILKRAVETLEAELQKERIRSQRAATKRREECRQLQEQLDEARASERTLRLKVKSLSNELAMYKRGRVTPTGPSPQSRAGSVGLAPTHRSGSRGEAGTRRERSTSRERSGRSSCERRSLTRQPRLSPSPVGLRPPRFDPTAYVKDRERRQKDVELKKGRRVSASPSSIRGQRRSSSVESLGSHRSYQSSVDDMEDTEPLASGYLLMQ
uniref:Centrosomal protein CCDC61 n=1 Tax=Xenopus laevis TaxID=8355 RepID=Q4KLQ8_XENLA|nr:MGC115653 protein [Xenopus laevis]